MNGRKLSGATVYSKLFPEVSLRRIQGNGMMARIRCGVSERLQEWEIIEYGLACFLPNGNDIGKRERVSGGKRGRR